MLNTTSQFGRALLAALALGLTGSVGFAADTQYYVNDPLATTVAISDAAGEIAAIEADAFGSQLAAGEAPNRYTGKPYDADLGAYVFPFRNYRPEEGRWMSADPSGFPDGVNNSIYIHSFITLDPLGLRSVTLLGEIKLDTAIKQGDNVLGSVGRSKYESVNTTTSGGAVLNLLPELNETATGVYLWRQRVTGKYSDGTFISFKGHALNNILDPVGGASSDREWYHYSDEIGDNKSISFEDTSVLEWSRLKSGKTWLTVEFTLELVQVANKSVKSGGTTVATFNWGYKLSE